MCVCTREATAEQRRRKEKLDKRKEEEGRGWLDVVLPSIFDLWMGICGFRWIWLESV